MVYCTLSPIYYPTIFSILIFLTISSSSLTPISTVVRGYNRFLNDGSLNGKAFEASAEKLLEYDLPEPRNGRITERAITVWEPLFKALHGEPSRLPKALL